MSRVQSLARHNFSPEGVKASRHGTGQLCCFVSQLCHYSKMHRMTAQPYKLDLTGGQLCKLALLDQVPETPV